MNVPNSKEQAHPAHRESGVHPAQEVDTVKLIYKPVARRVAHQVLVDRARSRSELKGRFGSFEVERLFSQVWDIYCELMPNESHLPADLAANGGRMNMRMTCLSIAFFQVLAAAGIERSYAAELISEISWKTYDKWKLFSGMTRRGQTEVVAQNDSDCPVSLPVSYFSPGGYRQVDARQRDRSSHKQGSGR
jgi:hypothetical protein